MSDMNQEFERLGAALAGYFDSIARQAVEGSSEEAQFEEAAKQLNQRARRLPRQRQEPSAVIVQLHPDFPGMPHDRMEPAEHRQEVRERMADDDVLALRRRVQELETEAKLAAIEQRLDSKIDGLVSEVRDMRSDLKVSIAAAEKRDGVLEERIGSVWKYVGLIQIGATVIVSIVVTGAGWWVTSHLTSMREIARTEAQNTVLRELRSVPQPQQSPGKSR